MSGSPQPVVIPVTNAVRQRFVVFFEPTANTPRVEDLIQTSAAWSDSHLPPPLRDLATKYRANGHLSIEVKATKDLPPIPIEDLMAMGMPESDELTLMSAVEAVDLSGPDLSVLPYVGLQ